MRTATATNEQVEASKATIKLEQTVKIFIDKSIELEAANRRLTHLIIILSAIQSIITIIAILK